MPSTPAITLPPKEDTPIKEGSTLQPRVFKIEPEAKVDIAPSKFKFDAVDDKQESQPFKFDTPDESSTGAFKFDMPAKVDPVVGANASKMAKNMVEVVSAITEKEKITKTKETEKIAVTAGAICQATGSSNGGNTTVINNNSSDTKDNFDMISRNFESSFQRFIDSRSVW
jgi:hypothetical protein